MGAEWAGEAYLQQQCLLKNILLEYGCFTMLCVSTVQQSASATRRHTSPPFWISFPLGHHGALSGLPCAVQQALISYLMQSANSVYVSTPVSQLLPPASCPSGTICLCSPSVYLEKCFFNKTVYLFIGCARSSPLRGLSLVATRRGSHWK